jgi:hypothetical protein
MVEALDDGCFDAVIGGSPVGIPIGGSPFGHPFWRIACRHPHLADHPSGIPPYDYYDYDDG